MKLLLKAWEKKLRTIDEIYSLDLKCKGCNHSLKSHFLNENCHGGFIKNCTCINFIMDYKQVLNAEMELSTARKIIFKNLEIAKRKYKKDFSEYNIMSYAELQAEACLLSNFPYLDPEIEERYNFIVTRIKCKLFGDKIEFNRFKTSP